MSNVPPELADRGIGDMLRKALEPAFVLVRELGAGGMGVVYLARDPVLKRLVAVKVMSPDRAPDPDARARFQREAEAVARIAHPNVVAIHTVGELANGIPYLVMQYVEGRSMADRLADEGPLAIDDAKAVLGQVASGLGAAHRKGIVHRDIKAENILWDDAAGRALVTDFGIAGLLEDDTEEDTSHLTKTGMVVGTPRYMSPEQLLAERVNEKTDIYSLGLLAYELLAREGPFPVTSPNLMVVAHLRDAPRPISTLRADVDPAFEALLAACLEKDPHSRPDAEDVARRLRHNTSVVLEWPPPGLEDLQGAAVRPARQFFLSALAMVAPLIVLVAAEPGSALDFRWPAALVFPGMVGLGAIATVLSAISIGRLLPRIIAAARAGYGWFTLGEVLADSRRDTGAVIVAEREYGSLPAAQRDGIRRWRVWRGVLRVAGGGLAISGVFIGLPLAVRLELGWGALAAVLLGVPVLTETVALVLAQREEMLLRPVRARQRRFTALPERLSNLAESWRESFESVTRGTGLGQGGFGRITRRLVAGAGIALGVAAGGAVVGGLAVVAAAGELMLSVGAITRDATQERMVQLERLRRLRVARDPAVTAVAAGAALHSLTATGNRQRFERAPAERIPAYSVPAYKDMFGPGWSEWIGGSAMRAAARGLTGPQRKFLESTASLPGEKQIELLARAPAVDWLGAAVELPSDGMTAFNVPEPEAFRLRHFASGHLARAILAYVDGRPADAERKIREVLSVGFATMDGRDLVGSLGARRLVQDAREDLVALYEVTGRGAQATAISRATDPPVRDAALTERRLTPAQMDAHVLSRLSDTTVMRAIRWEYLRSHAAVRPCMELGQILFGPAPEYHAQMAAARRTLVHTPGDEALMQLAERTITAGLVVRENASVDERALAAFARTVDALTGSRRMSSCMSLATGAMQ